MWQKWTLMKYLISLVFLTFGATIAMAEDRLTAAVAAIDADVVFMRHALAPGVGDPADFTLENCNTQRNLDSVGRQQAAQIGAEIRRSKTRFSEVLSSEWCRCKETTELLGLQQWSTFSGLNSFFQDYAEKSDVIERLVQKLNNLNPGVTLMVTHQVVIRAATGQSVASGELVAFNTRSKETYKFQLD